MIIPPTSAGCYDDYTIKQQAHLQRQFHQLAPLTIDGGRELLWWCQYCRSAWRQQGRAAYEVDLDETRTEALAHVLGVADVASLPVAICPICSLQMRGGLSQVEAYQGFPGYRFWWDRPPRTATVVPAQLFCAVASALPFAFGATHDAIIEALRSATDAPASPDHVRAVLRWLMEAPDPLPHQLRPLSVPACDLLARKRSPAAERQWCGYAWGGYSPLLGEVTLIMAVAFYRDAQCSYKILVECWRQIARMLVQSL